MRPPHWPTEQVQLLESIGDPTLTLALLTAAISVKHETAEMHEVLRLAQYAIELAGGDATKGGKIATSSPLALAMSFRGLARWCLGITGWRDDFDQAVQMVKTAEAVTRGGVLYYTYTKSILHGVLRPGDAILHEMTEICRAPNKPARTSRSGWPSPMWPSPCYIGMASRAHTRWNCSDKFETSPCASGTPEPQYR